MTSATTDLPIHPPPSSFSSSATPTPRPLSSLPAPFSTSPTPLHLISQGAEALLYRTTFLSASTPCALKIRPPKPWRHGILDKRLTRARVLAEARVLVKIGQSLSSGEGVKVPAVLGLDWERGWIALEWIEGRTVKEVIRQSGREKKDGDEEKEEEEELKGLLHKIGRAVGQLHQAGIVHGDLTTSNMMLRATDASTAVVRTAHGEEEDGDDATDAAAASLSLEGEIVLIDFGLATQATQEEDRAVDLYVLERAFGSTHPREEGLFEEVLKAYGGCFEGARATLRRLEDVRMRGRKKSMIG